MLYKKFKDKIEVYDKSQFEPQHILECGQVFCFEKTDRGYVVFPSENFAEITEKDDCYPGLYLLVKSSGNSSTAIRGTPQCWVLLTVTQQ